MKLKKLNNIPAQDLHLERVMMLRRLEQRLLKNKSPVSNPPSHSPTTNNSMGLQVSTISAQSVRAKLTAMASHNLSAHFDNLVQDMPVPKIFDMFKKLAPELRLRIWSFALRDIDARVIEVMWDSEREEFYAACSIPAVLHVCQESRVEALRRYTKFTVENTVKKVTAGVEPVNLNDRERSENILEKSDAGRKILSKQQAVTEVVQLDDGENVDVVHQPMSRPFGAYINFNQDLLYLSLGSFTRAGAKYTEKMVDFLSRINAGTATRIQKIALEPPLYPFNAVLQAMARFSDLRICAGVKSDICLSYVNSQNLNSAPRLPAIGFNIIIPEYIGESRRWSVHTGRVEQHTTEITWEQFAARLARLRASASAIGINRDWVSKVEFVAMDIVRDESE